MKAAPGKVLLNVEEIKISEILLLNKDKKKVDYKFTVKDCNCDWLKVGDEVLLYNHASIQSANKEGTIGVVHEHDIWAIK